MKITASMICDLAALGLSPEQMAGVVMAIEKNAGEQPRSAAAIRQARYRERHSNVTRDVTGVTGDAQSDAKERSPTPPKEILPSEANASSGSKRTAADELAAVLDRAHAEAVVAHRKAMRKPLTPHAARLLADKFAKSPDPNAGADTMIASGWQGFDSAWMARATGPPGGRSQNGMAAIAIEKGLAFLDEQYHHHTEAGRPGASRPADPGTAPFAGGPDERGHGREWPDGPSPRQGDQRGRAPGHAGPVIDLEAIPRRA